MKKVLSVVLAIMMLVCSAAFSLAEGTENIEEKKAAEMEKVLVWLATQIPEEEATTVLTWDKETILAKLEGYEEPLEYTTKEEIADELLQVLSLFNLLGSLANNGENSDGSETGGTLAALLGGLLGGTGEGSGLDLSTLLSGSGEEGGLDLSALLGGLLGGSGEEGGLDLSGLFGGLTVEDGQEGEDANQEGEAYEIYELFDGTYWESGDLKLEAVFQDGYYKVVITEGDKELSYLCEYHELEDGDTYYARLISVGTGVEEFDAEQEDHGVATFVMNDEGQLVWQKADGTEVAFTEIVDPLTTKEWYGDGKKLHIAWMGNEDYTVTIDDGVEGHIWTYQCTLDVDSLIGTGKKEQYGEEIYTDANVILAFGEGRIEVTWTDDKEPAEGVVFEMVEEAFTMTAWEAEGVDSFTGYFDDGTYHINVMLNGTEYSYVCTYDRAGGKLTAVDPATLDSEELAEPENFRSTATFELQDEDHLRWVDDSGITGEDGIVLTRMV